VTWLDGSSTHIGPGFRLVDRIGALQRPVELHRTRYRWYLDWIDRLNARRFSPWGRRSRRRGVPVS
jgi:hypothetical protein